MDSGDDDHDSFLHFSSLAPQWYLVFLYFPLLDVDVPDLYEVDSTLLLK